jgi:Flp pilus assembly protein TadG
VEFVLSLPIMLLILTGIFTFGIAMNNYLTLTNAVCVGAELLSVSRGQTTDPCALTAGAIYNAAPLLGQSGFKFTFVLNGSSYSGTSCSSSSTTTGAAGNLVQGANAQITATYPCSLVVYGVNYIPNCALTAQVTEVVQ